MTTDSTEPPANQDPDGIAASNKSEDWQSVESTAAASDSSQDLSAPGSTTVASKPSDDSPAAGSTTVASNPSDDSPAAGSTTVASKPSDDWPAAALTGEDSTAAGDGNSSGDQEAAAVEKKAQKWRNPKCLRFVNSTRKTVLAERADNARTVFARFKGLLGTRELPEGRGILLNPCNGIHMFWMTYAIDAIFVDRDYKVVGLVSNIQPWMVSKVFRNARACLELPTGTIARSATQVGDVLNFEPVGE